MVDEVPTGKHFQKTIKHLVVREGERLHSSLENSLLQQIMSNIKDLKNSPRFNWKERLKNFKNIEID